jgi:hypothetical protein
MHVLILVMMLSLAGLGIMAMAAVAAPLTVSPNPEADSEISPQDEEGEEPDTKQYAPPQGMTQAALFRQLQPQVYPRYEKKIVSIHKSLKNASAYLDSLNGEMPSLQRICAFDADVWLDWTDVDQRLTEKEKAFRSYQLIREAVLELHGLARYWATAEKMKRVYRGTIQDEQQDLAVIQGRTQRIKAALKALHEFDVLKQDLNAELPY